MRRVVWSADAHRDYLDILAYIADDNPDAAERVVDAIEDAGNRLSEFATGRPGRVHHRLRADGRGSSDRPRHPCGPRLAGGGVAVTSEGMRDVILTTWTSANERYVAFWSRAHGVIDSVILREAPIAATSESN